MLVPMLQQCQECLAHYSGEHTCPPWLKMLKKLHDEKKEAGHEKCLTCGMELIPDLKSVTSGTEEWDGHTWMFACDCVKDTKLRLSIG